MQLELDKRDTTALKGLAIAAIVLHNYFHVVSAARPNEFAFGATGFKVFLATVVQPAHAVQALFSFWGHFGVQIFIFLSAYGLARSHWDDLSSWTAFMRSRVKKLYPYFGIALVGWMIVVASQTGVLEAIRRLGMQYLLMLTGLYPLWPGLRLPAIGPWWFIPFVIEFYALWPLLRWLTQKTGWKGLLALSILCMIVSYPGNPILSRWLINLLETPIGRMPTICLGIAAARYPMRLNAKVALPAFAVLIAGSAYKAIWLLTFPASTVVLLYLYLALRPALRGRQLLAVLGTYSLTLFLFNGIVRIPFLGFADSPVSQLALGSASTLCSLAVAVYAQRIVLRVEILVGQLGSRPATALATPTADSVEAR